MAEPPSSPTPRIRSKSPAVAIVIPCFNHGQFLPDALASARAQTHPKIECIVVDDGSTDPATLAALDRARKDGVRVIRQENAGLAAARNAGIRVNDAPYFVPLDADDRIEPRFVEKLLGPLLADPTLGYCYSHVQFFGAMTGNLEFPAYDPRRLLYQNLSVATAVVRRRAYDEAGGYQTDMLHGFEDWDLWIALLAAGWTGRLVPEPLFCYRKHDAGSMLTHTQRHRGEMIQKMIEHHRPLFAAMLEDSLEGKDRLFFQAHTDVLRLRERLFAGGGANNPAAAAGRGPSEDDELFQMLLVEAELSHIENSRFWRMMRRLHLAPTNRSGDDSPPARLGRIKSSAAYRLIQAVKHTPAYRWYARRKYGPDFGARA